MCVCVCAQSCLTLCNPRDCSPPGSPVHGVLPARILEWVSTPSSRESSWPGNWTLISCIAGRFFTHGTTWEAQVTCRILQLWVMWVGCCYLQAHQSSPPWEDLWSWWYWVRQLTWPGSFLLLKILQVKAKQTFTFYTVSTFRFCLL